VREEEEGSILTGRRPDTIRSGGKEDCALDWGFKRGMAVGGKGENHETEKASPERALKKRMSVTARGDIGLRYRKEGIS